MSTPFHLLKLPLVAQQEVFKKFEIVDIVEISFTSTRVRDTLRSTRLRAVEHHVKFSHDYPYITTKSKNDGECCLRLVFLPFPLSIQNRPDMKIGCHQFGKCFVPDDTILCTHHNVEFAASILFDYIFAIFPGPVDLKLSVCNIRNLSSLLLNKNFTNCQKLEVHETAETEVCPLDLEEIVKEVRVEKEINIYTTQCETVRIEQIFNLETVILHNAQWITLPDLLSLNCRFGSFRKFNINQNLLEAFSKNWLNSKSRTLEFMKFGFPEHGVSFQWNKSELPLKPWNPQIRSRYYYLKKDLSLAGIEKSFGSNYIDCSEGLDIIRSDGLTATILIQDNFDKNILFLVWRDPHPENSRITELKEQILVEIDAYTEAKTQQTNPYFTHISDSFMNDTESTEYDLFGIDMFLKLSPKDVIYEKVEKVFRLKKEIKMLREQKFDV